MRQILLAAIVPVLLAASAQSEGRPLAGDVTHGEKLYRAASKGEIKVDGNWINAYTDDQIISALRAGKGGFPRITSDNILDLYDVVAFIRSRNTDIRDLTSDTTHVLHTSGAYDNYAVERLADRAKIKDVKEGEKRAVFAFFKLKKSEGADLTIVRDDDHRRRDQLKPKQKSGYAVFVPLPGLREGGYEAAFAVDADINLTRVVIRAPDGGLPDDLNQIAGRLVGRGGRGKYDKLKLVGAGKAVRELEGPLAEAFLLGMESVYMYEVDERDHFLFDE